MNHERNKLIGKNVRFHRTTRGMSIVQMAAALPEPISSQQLAKYEVGTSRWPVDLVIDISNMLGIPVDTLMGVDTEIKKEGGQDWDAERHKHIILELPVRLRQMMYLMIQTARTLTI